MQARSCMERLKMFDDVAIEVDEVFDSLVKPCANDGACKDVLQCLFTSFIKLGKRMLEWWGIQ